MQIAIVTLFPQMFDAVSEHGITGRAINTGLASLSYWNPRDFTQDRHRTVDDKPFGGGPGMLMKTEPLVAAIQAARQALDSVPGSTDLRHIAPPAQQPEDDRGVTRVIYLSPQGRPINQTVVKQLTERKKLVLVCGRYQGIDQRVLDAEIDEELSLGDFVLSGGELAAMALIDAMIRFAPGALGAGDSAEQDSFADGLLHCPQFTRPQEVAGKAVPETLLSGDHEQIRRWRLKHSLGATWRKRPDLLETVNLNSEQQALLAEYIDEYDTSRTARAAKGQGSGADK